MSFIFLSITPVFQALYPGDFVSRHIWLNKHGYISLLFWNYCVPIEIEYSVNSCHTPIGELQNYASRYEESLFFVSPPFLLILIEIF